MNTTSRIPVRKSSDVLARMGLMFGREMMMRMLCLASILLAGGGMAHGGEAASQSRTRWEYKIWVQPDDTDAVSNKARIENQLNALGAEGWELVSVVWQKYSDGTAPAGRMVHYFKRAVARQQAAEGGKAPSKEAAGKTTPSTELKPEDATKGKAEAEPPPP